MLVLHAQETMPGLCHRHPLGNWSFKLKSLCLQNKCSYLLRLFPSSKITFLKALTLLYVVGGQCQESIVDAWGFLHLTINSMCLGLTLMNPLSAQHLYSGYLFTFHTPAYYHTCAPTFLPFHIIFYIDSSGLSAFVLCEKHALPLYFGFALFF